MNNYNFKPCRVCTPVHTVDKKTSCLYTGGDAVRLHGMRVYLAELHEQAT